MCYRWFQKRIARYSEIFCNVSEVTMLAPHRYCARRGLDKGTASCMVLCPLLPSLLATCPPSIPVHLSIHPTQGKSAELSNLQCFTAA